MARELGADESEERFEQAFRKIVPAEETRQEAASASWRIEEA